MKKYQILVSLIVLFFGIIGFTMIVNAAEVLYLEGRVQMQSSTDIEWTPLAKGMQVEIGDSIRTARNSFVDIALDKAKLNTIRIDPKSLVVLNSENSGTFDRLDLTKGRVVANLEDLKSGMNFEINTPSAIAGVRGSSYSVYVEKDSDEVLAFKDTVFIKAFDFNKNELLELMLPEGFKTFIERFGEPSALIQIATQEFERFDNIMEDVSSSIEGKMVERAKARIARENKAKEASEENKKSLLEKSNEQVDVNKDLVDRFSDIQEIIEDRNKIEELIENHEEEYEEYYEEEQP
ncbi:MAG: FecR family protein [Candidatus Omnitrophica bacterium]|nr:FecR family protein [Candidatus Omnitrophota bacterium]MBU1995787.1 FecR family protein [Candidatus Omnitrophota bacterium]MBU4334203.1 FecR family protein [Candidatus Omnitrophota bacterium]